MKEKTVWTFSNKKSLTKSEFLRYIQRKVFKTIRENGLLPEEKIFRLKKSDSINTLVLKNILDKKFKTKFSKNPNISTENLTQIAEIVMEKAIRGDFDFSKLPKSPLSKVSDEEILLYARLLGICAKKRPKNKKIHGLLDRFKKKNPDIERNIIRAASQFLR